MQKIQQKSIDQVLARTDVVDLIGQFITLKKQGSNYLACCPFHQEKTPSFTISPQKQFYYCFGCGAHGDAISFIKDYQHVSYIEAIEQLAKKAGVTLSFDGTYTPKIDLTNYYACLNWLNLFYQNQLKQTRPAIEYLQNRGMNGKIARDFNIGYAPKHKHLTQSNLTGLDANLLLELGMLNHKDEQNYNYERFKARIIFPIRTVYGQVIGFGGRVLDDSLPKYLNSPQSLVFNKSDVIYGLYESLTGIKEAQKILVVEGYMDVVMLHQYGINYAVASMGTACTEQHIAQLLRYTKHIIFAFDGDRAGKQAAERVLTRLMPLLKDDLRIEFMFLPDKHDPDSYVKSMGKQGFETLLNESLNLSAYLLQLLLEQKTSFTPEAQAMILKRAKIYLDKMPTIFFKQTFTQALKKSLGLLAQNNQSTLDDITHTNYTNSINDASTQNYYNDSNYSNNNNHKNDYSNYQSKQNYSNNQIKNAHLKTMPNYVRQQNNLASLLEQLVYLLTLTLQNFKEDARMDIEIDNPSHSAQSLTSPIGLSAYQQFKTDNTWHQALKYIQYSYENWPDIERLIELKDVLTLKTRYLDNLKQQQNMQQLMFNQLQTYAETESHLNHENNNINTNKQAKQNSLKITYKNALICTQASIQSILYKLIQHGMQAYSELLIRQITELQSQSHFNQNLEQLMHLKQTYQAIQTQLKDLHLQVVQL